MYHWVIHLLVVVMPVAVVRSAWATSAHQTSPWLAAATSLVVLARLAKTELVSPSITLALVQRLTEKNPHLYQRDVEKIVNAILDEVTGALAGGNRVELRGFGAFSVKRREARLGRNPRTGAHVDVNEKMVPFFKTGKEMRERLNIQGD